MSFPCTPLHQTGSEMAGKETEPSPLSNLLDQEQSSKNSNSSESLETTEKLKSMEATTKVTENVKVETQGKKGLVVAPVYVGSEEVKKPALWSVSQQVTGKEVLKDSKEPVTPKTQERQGSKDMTQSPRASVPPKVQLDSSDSSSSAPQNMSCNDSSLNAEGKSDGNPGSLHLTNSKLEVSSKKRKASISDENADQSRPKEPRTDSTVDQDKKKGEEHRINPTSVKVEENGEGDLKASLLQGDGLATRADNTIWSLGNNGMFVDITSSFLKRYWRNDRKNLQCFPTCPEFGDYFTCRLNGFEHRPRKGACREPINLVLRFDSQKYDLKQLTVIGRFIVCPSHLNRQQAPGEKMKWGLKKGFGDIPQSALTNELLHNGKSLTRTQLEEFKHEGYIARHDFDSTVRSTPSASQSVGSAAALGGLNDKQLNLVNASFSFHAESWRIDVPLSKRRHNNSKPLSGGTQLYCFEIVVFNEIQNPLTDPEKEGKYQLIASKQSPHFEIANTRTLVRRLSVLKETAQNQGATVNQTVSRGSDMLRDTKNTSKALPIPGPTSNPNSGNTPFVPFVAQQPGFAPPFGYVSPYFSPQYAASSHHAQMLAQQQYMQQLHAGQFAQFPQHLLTNQQPPSQLNQQQGENQSQRGSIQSATNQQQQQQEAHQQQLFLQQQYLQPQHQFLQNQIQQLARQQQLHHFQQMQHQQKQQHVISASMGIVSQSPPISSQASSMPLHVSSAAQVQATTSAMNANFDVKTQTSPTMMAVSGNGATTDTMQNATSKPMVSNGIDSSVLNSQNTQEGLSKQTTLKTEGGSQVAQTSTPSPFIPNWPYAASTQGGFPLPQLQQQVLPNISMMPVFQPQPFQQIPPTAGENAAEQKLE